MMETNVTSIMLWLMERNEWLGNGGDERVWNGFRFSTVAGKGQTDFGKWLWVKGLRGPQENQKTVIAKFKRVDGDDHQICFVVVVVRKA